MGTEAFAAYDTSGAPLTGLSPTWSAIYDAGSGASISSPSVTEVGSTGLYRFFRPGGYDLTGIIDLGATASPRYMFATPSSVEAFAAYDTSGAPLTGLSPTWNTLYSVVSGTAFTPQPSFTEIGGGVYKFARPAATEHVGGIIDLGATASPRYLYFETSRGVMPAPPVTLVGVGAGGGGYYVD